MRENQIVIIWIFGIIVIALAVATILYLVWLGEKIISVGMVGLKNNLHRVKNIILKRR